MNVNITKQEECFSQETAYLENKPRTCGTSSDYPNYKKRVMVSQMNI